MKFLFNDRSWGWWGFSGQACSQHDVLQLPLLSELSRRGSWNPHIRIQSECRGQAEKENSVLPPRIIQKLVPRKLVQKEYRSTRGRWRVRLNETYQQSLYLDSTTNVDCCSTFQALNVSEGRFISCPHPSWTKCGNEVFTIIRSSLTTVSQIDIGLLNFYSRYKLPLRHFF